MYHTHLKLEAIHIDGCLANTIHATHLRELQLRQLLAREMLVGSSQHSLGHTTSCAKDVPSASCVAQRVVKLPIRQLSKVNTFAPNHLGEFQSSNTAIHIGDAVVDKLVASAFIFLCHTRHYRNHRNILAWNANFLGPVRLGQRAKHLCRRLAGRRILAQVGVVILKEIHPSRAARCCHGQLHVGVACHVPL